MHINDSKLRLYEQWQCFASFNHEISNSCENGGQCVARFNIVVLKVVLSN